MMGFVWRKLLFLRVLTVVIVGWLVSGCGNKSGAEGGRCVVNFNHDWMFVKDGVESVVSLPHTANVEPLVVNEMWTGLCTYKKVFQLGERVVGKKVLVRFEGAMQRADVSVNGTHLLTHKGGYLPFVVDMSEVAKVGQNVVEVKLDNRYDSHIPPGKPLGQLDFSWFSGIYRNVNLVIKEKLHITDAVAADKVAGGGVFVTCKRATKKGAVLQVNTQVRNGYSEHQNMVVRVSLWGEDGVVVINAVSKGIKGQGDVTVSQVLNVANPKLWSPKHPNLYDLKVDTLLDGVVTDSETVRVGIRHVEVSSKGFFINGERMYLRGTNRHQEYPYLGYALSDEANYRDAVKIKAAGFDLVRLSHYPQSPAFLTACDELGIVVMDAIPGWQFFQKGEFAVLTLRHIRDMIRNDRNHPSVIFWEASLNETRSVGDAFVKKMHDIVHEEYPGDQAFSVGWIDRHFDVFIPARQHGRFPNFWNDWQNGDKAILTAEYGDWEYYANQKANFNQSGAKTLKRYESNSRQRRGDGEVLMLQQALNFQESHNQNHRCKAMIGDCNWLFNDYNRGYANNHCESGVVDLLRVPKFVYYFYQSQRDVEEKSTLFASGPMVFAATWWDNNSPLEVRVFSNCDEVELWLDGESLGRQMPDKNQFSTHLNHPPFTFKLKRFRAGTMKAVGYVNGVPMATHIVKTPGRVVAVTLSADYCGKALQADGADAVFIRAKLVDENGTVVPVNGQRVTFSVKGHGKLVGPAIFKSEAGVSSTLLQAGLEAGKITVTAKVDGLAVGSIVVESR